MMKKSLKGLAIGASLVMAMGLLVGCGGEKKAAPEKKMVKVYDYDQKAEVPQEKEVLMDLVRGKLELGIQELTVDKTIKSDTGEYVPTGETRDINELSKVFTEDGLTLVEKEAGATEAKFKAAWIKQYADKKINKAKGKADGAKAGGVAKPAASPLFG